MKKAVFKKESSVEEDINNSTETEMSTITENILITNKDEIKEQKVMENSNDDAPEVSSGEQVLTSNIVEEVKEISSVSDETVIETSDAIEVEEEAPVKPARQTRGKKMKSIVEEVIVQDDAVKTPAKRSTRSKKQMNVEAVITDESNLLTQDTINNSVEKEIPPPVEEVKEVKKRSTRGRKATAALSNEMKTTDDHEKETSTLAMTDSTITSKTSTSRRKRTKSAQEEIPVVIEEKKMESEVKSKRIKKVVSGPSDPSDVEEEIVEKKGRGRLARAATKAVVEPVSEIQVEIPTDPTPIKPRSTRGKKAASIPVVEEDERKKAQEKVKGDEAIIKSSTAAPVKRGRKATATQVIEEKEEEVVASVAPVKRGRKATVAQAIEEKEEEVVASPAPMKRGRKPKSNNSNNTDNDKEEIKENVPEIPATSTQARRGKKAVTAKEPEEDIKVPRTRSRSTKTSAKS